MEFSRNSGRQDNRKIRLEASSSEMQNYYFVKAGVRKARKSRSENFRMALQKSWLREGRTLGSQNFSKARLKKDRE